MDIPIVKELAPTGTLRVGVVVAPAASAFFVVKDAAGQPRGVTADLGRDLARQLGLPLELAVFSNSGELTDALSGGMIDVAFMPVDEERRQRVAFGPAYYLLESTYLVRGDSDIRTLADVDRPHIRVVGIANTTTIRSAARSLALATLTAARSVEEALHKLRTQDADALALSRDSFATLMVTVPGSRVLDGGFQQTGVAIAVPKNRPAALGYVTAFLEIAKASGSVRRALDAAGFKDAEVAPAGV
jgi:polar amino acid transport system substrate-binding protein